jgi:ketosteroid isomerase-like protein
MEIKMPLALTQVRDIFKNLETGDGSGFFTHVSDDVDWIVEGTHPLAGHYHSKADFLAHTFKKLDKVLPQGTQLNLEHALVSGDWAVVELRSLATAKNGSGLTTAIAGFAGSAVTKSLKSGHISTPVWWLNFSGKIRLLRRPERPEPRSNGDRDMTSKQSRKTRRYSS